MILDLQKMVNVFAEGAWRKTKIDNPLFLLTSNERDILLHDMLSSAEKADYYEDFWTVSAYEECDDTHISLLFILLP